MRKRPSELPRLNSVCVFSTVVNLCSVRAGTQMQSEDSTLISGLIGFVQRLFLPFVRSKCPAVESASASGTPFGLGRRASRS